MRIVILLAFLFGLSYSYGLNAEDANYINYFNQTNLSRLTKEQIIAKAIDFKLFFIKKYNDVILENHLANYKTLEQINFSAEHEIKLELAEVKLKKFKRDVAIGVSITLIGVIVISVLSVEMDKIKKSKTYSILYGR